MTRPVRVSLCGSHYRRLRAHLFPGDGKEAAAIALCGRRAGEQHDRLLVREIHPIPYEVCTRRDPDAIGWPVEWVDDLLDRAAAEHWSIIKFHSHPGNFRRFSKVDDKSDAALFPGIHALVDQSHHASIVMMSDGSMFGRTVGSTGEFAALERITLAGDDIAFWWDHHSVLSARAAEVGRTTPAFGQKMSCELSRLSAAVIGCSGTGSIVIEQLARLGFGRLVLVDPEFVERKNMNRIVNAIWPDAEQRLPKVEVARRAILAMELGTQVETCAENLVNREVVGAVADCDIIFGCVDSAEGRDVLNRISTHYLLPYIDMGVRISALLDGTIDQIDAVVHYIQPGGSSLLSRQAYRAEQVAADALKRINPELYAERQREKYIIGTDEEAPAVISVNMTVAAMAVNEMLGRLYHTRNQPNRRFATTRINLAEMEIETEAEGAPCPVFAPDVGAGDIDPLLNRPELSA